MPGIFIITDYKRIAAQKILKTLFKNRLKMKTKFSGGTKMEAKAVNTAVLGYKKGPAENLQSL